MKLLLTAISGSCEGRSFTIEPQQRLTFGRTNASAISFEDDGHMSSVHFEVENLGTHAEARDLGSTNGTWLNNQKILAEQLRDGDRLRAGKTVLTVELVRGTVEPPREPRPPQEDGQFNWAPAVLPPSSYPTPPDQPAPGREKSPPDTANMSEVPRQPGPLVPAQPVKPPPVVPPMRLSGATDRPANPFESIDFSDSKLFSRDEEPTPAPPPLMPYPPAGESARREVSNPFDESSVAFVYQAPGGTSPEAAKTTPRGYQFMTRRTTTEAADSLAIIVDTLSQQWSVQLVLHFQKIRAAPPGDCPGSPLFSWLSGPSAIEFSPIRLGWNDFRADETIQALCPRLCRADACIAFFGKSSIEIGQQIEAMLAVGLEPFSEPGGFLPVCWPSSLATILESQGVAGCESLFGDKIAGALMCSVWNRNYVLAAAANELAQVLVENGFAPSSSLSTRD